MLTDPPGSRREPLDEIGRMVIGCPNRPHVAVGGIIIGIIGREKTVVAVDGINTQPIPGRPIFRLFL